MCVKSRKIYKASCHAKLNLRLAVTGVREDGYHTLDMIIYPYAALSDEVEFVPSRTNSLKIVGAFKGFEDERFSRFFMPKFEKISSALGVKGTVKLKKGVPLGAGLGGSSACLVATIKAMQMCAGRELGQELWAKLGSDVPCMMTGGACRVQGAGEIITPLELDLSGYDIEVKIAGGGCDSGAVYRAFDESGAPFDDSGKALDTLLQEGLNMETLIEKGVLKNDLTAAAISCNEEISRAIDGLKAKGEGFVLMSGSGSAVARIFKA